MPATVETIDFDLVFKQITDRLKQDEVRRLATPQTRIWNGNWVLVGEVYREISASFEQVENDNATGTVELPATYYLAKWLTQTDARAGAKNVFITVDYRGTRWSGTLTQLDYSKDAQGNRTVIATFVHDISHLDWIIAFANPFLPPELQFPKTFLMFGQAIFAVKMAMLLNLWRLEDSVWSIPDNPLDVAGWIDELTGMSNWSQAVMPWDSSKDSSQLCLITSRFKSMKDATKRAMTDGQLTWVPRRYLDGDDPPWEGANLKHGCLVWDVVDNSGWDTETSFGGNLFTGLIRAVTTISDDGITQGVDVIDDPAFPEEYSTPGYKGTLPNAPGLIIRDGDRTAITSGTFTWKPATAVGFVTGGHSMPGVNEAISAAINMAGDLTASAIGIPPIGGTVDAVLKPLYTDTILAFQKFKLLARAEDLGWSHFHEAWCEGGDRSYTLAALIALRTQMWKTREQISHTIEITDGYEGVHVGAAPYGNLGIGTRLGVTVKGFGTPGQVWVDRVSKLTLGWARDTTPGFKIQLGSREQTDPILKGFEMIKDLFGVTQDLGVL